MIVYESSYFHLIWALFSASKLPLGLPYFVMFSAHPVITNPLRFQGKGQSPHDSMEKYHHLFQRRACAMGYIGMATFGKCHLHHQSKERFSYSSYKNKQLYLHSCGIFFFLAIRIENEHLFLAKTSSLCVPDLTPSYLLVVLFSII